MSSKTGFPSDLLVWRAPAKINLFLHITRRRSDGYHELQTVFQLLDYGDHLAFDVGAASGVHRISEVPNVPESEDLVVKAAKLLQSQAGVRQGVNIYLDKRLPMGGGLGGGSSDAATTLVALNQLWHCGVSEADLIELGGQLGADIPVFIQGKSAWAEGIGDQLKPLLLPFCFYLVVNPGVHVSTAELFSDSELTRDCRAITIRDFLGGAGQNVFEPLVKKRYPQVALAMDWLDQFSSAKLTGTGGCVFAAFENENDAKRAFRDLPTGMSGFLAKGINESPIISG